MTLEQVKSAAKRLGSDLTTIAANLTLADVKSLSLTESAQLINLLRAASDAAQEFKNSLPKQKNPPRFLAR